MWCACARANEIWPDVNDSLSHWKIDVAVHFKAFAVHRINVDEPTITSFNYLYIYGKRFRFNFHFA